MCDSSIICQLCKTPIDVSWEIEDCKDSLEPNACGKVYDYFQEEAECNVCYTTHTFRITFDGEMPKDDEDEYEDFEGDTEITQVLVMKFGEIPEGYVYVPPVPKNPNQLRISLS